MTDPESERKIWIAVRTDIAMSPGKLAVQSAHGAMGLFDAKRRGSDLAFEEYLSGAAPKIAVRVGSESELRRVGAEARAAAIDSYLVVDAGRTELAASTATVCVFGPAYRDELPPFLKRLQLL